MAVKTKLWIQAHLRRCFGAGLTGAVLCHGADEAGIIFIKVYMARDQYRLFGPPIGPSLNDAGDRIWDTPLGREPLPNEAVEEYLGRQLKYDPDIWIIEIDDPSGDACLS